MKNQNLRLGVFAFCISLLTALSSFNAQAQQKATQEIKFSQRSYKEVLALARKSHKKVFVDAYATWCAPCKELRKRTFNDAKTAAYFNKNFINFSVDVERGEGVELAKTWQVEGLPTLLIVDENGKVLANHTGFVDGPGLIEFAGEATGADPAKHSAALNR
jgi:thiol:disulfide interchange protein